MYMRKLFECVRHVLSSSLCTKKKRDIPRETGGVDQKVISINICIPILRSVVS